MKLRMVAVAFVLTSSVLAQKPPAFEVASVKPDHSSDPRGGHVEFLPGGRLSIHNIGLSAIISLAYDLPSIRPSGCPGCPIGRDLSGSI